MKIQPEIYFFNGSSSVQVPRRNETYINKAGIENVRSASDFRSNIIRDMQCKSILPSIEFKLVSTKKELDELEERLNGTEYFNNITQWLNEINTRCDRKNKMPEARDIVFDPVFATCSWQCGPPNNFKIPLMKCRNICNLFKNIGSTEYNQPNTDDVEALFKLKLRYAWGCISLKGIKKTSCQNPVK